MIRPKLLLQLEGAAVLLGACIFYQRSQNGWLWFALLFLAPDISMFGYLAGKKAGAAIYNLAHTYTAPMVLWLVLMQTAHGWLALIWFAHIGFDRVLG